MDDQGGHYLLWHELLVLLAVWVLPALVPALVAHIIFLKRYRRASKGRIGMFVLASTLASFIAVIGVALVGPDWMKSFNELLSMGDGSLTFAPALYVVVVLVVSLTALLFALRRPMAR